MSKYVKMKYQLRNMNVSDIIYTTREDIIVYIHGLYRDIFLLCIQVSQKANNIFVKIGAVLEPIPHKEQ